MFVKIGKYIFDLFFCNVGPSYRGPRNSNSQDALATKVGKSQQTNAAVKTIIVGTSEPRDDDAGKMEYKVREQAATARRDKYTRLASAKTPRTKTQDVKMKLSRRKSQDARAPTRKSQDASAKKKKW